MPDEEEALQITECRPDLEPIEFVSTLLISKHT